MGAVEVPGRVRAADGVFYDGEAHIRNVSGLSH
jgi:hypothetical protein